MECASTDSHARVGNVGAASETTAKSEYVLPDGTTFCLTGNANDLLDCMEEYWARIDGTRFDEGVSISDGAGANDSGIGDAVRDDCSGDSDVEQGRVTFNAARVAHRELLHGFRRRLDGASAARVKHLEMLRAAAKSRQQARLCR